MSEEEKEAVDTLAIRASTSKAGYEDYPNCVCMKKHLIVVLNLMQKQQKEIEKNKEDIQRMQELLDLSNANNVKKDNIINEMANKYDNLVEKIEEKSEEIGKELEQMKVDNVYGRYKGYGGKTKWERLFAEKYGMHDILQELKRRAVNYSPKGC